MVFGARGAHEEGTRKQACLEHNEVSGGAGTWRHSVQGDACSLDSLITVRTYHRTPCSWPCNPT